MGRYNGCMYMDMTCSECRMYDKESFLICKRQQVKDYKAVEED